MILVDANLLLYAEDSLSSHHEPARTWWDAGRIAVIAGAGSNATHEAIEGVRAAKELKKAVSDAASRLK